MPARCGRLAQPPGECEDDRPLVRGGEIGAALGEAGVAQVADRVEQGRLDTREGEVEARHARDRETERLGIALRGRARRSRRRPGTASPSSRAPLSNASPAASSSVVPSRSNEPRRRTASRSVWPPLARRQTNGGSTAAQARGTATRRAPGGGRPGRAGCRATRRSPSRPRGRRGERRSGPARG